MCSADPRSGDPGLRFGRSEEERIASASLWGIIGGGASIAAAFFGGSLLLLSGPVATYGLGLFDISVALVLGLWLIQASIAFRQAARGSRSARHHLLVGFSKLRSYFMLTSILIAIVVGLSVVQFVVSFGS